MSFWTNPESVCSESAPHQSQGVTSGRHIETRVKHMQAAGSLKDCGCASAQRQCYPTGRCPYPTFSRLSLNSPLPPPLPTALSLCSQQTLSLHHSYFFLSHSFPTGKEGEGALLLARPTLLPACSNDRCCDFVDTWRRRSCGTHHRPLTLLLCLCFETFTLGSLLL